MNNEVAFDGLEQFHDYLRSKGGANPQTHGNLGNFYLSMEIYRNPNTCGCKKGKRALDRITSFLVSLPSTVTNEQAIAIKTLVDNQTLVVKANGTEILRY